jgi:hypothetical protein
MYHHKVLYASIPTVFLTVSMVAGTGQLTPIEPQRVNDINYTSGEASDPQLLPVVARQEGYNLRLTFATAETGAYLDHVDVIIQNGAHQKLLETEPDGPLFYAQLPTGRYRIVARRDGVEQVRVIEVGDRRMNRFVFYWTQEASAVPVAKKSGARSAVASAPVLTRTRASAAKGAPEGITQVAAAPDADVHRALVAY